MADYLPKFTPGQAVTFTASAEVTGAPEGAAYEERWVAEPRHLLTGPLMTPYRRPPRGATGR